MGRNVWISQFVYIDELHPADVEIGDNCTIGLEFLSLRTFIGDPEDQRATAR